MDSDENSYTTTNQTYKIWKKHTPFLYNLLQVYELPSCSQTIDWFTDNYLDHDWKMQSLLIGTNSISQNSLQLISVSLPTDDSITDYSAYREEKPEQSCPSNGYIGSMGLQYTNVKVSIPQAGEIMKARINRFDQNLVAVKIGGANAQFIVYDLRNKEEQLQNSSIKLQGHSQQGFGLAWSPHNQNQLLSGSYDGKIICFDINAIKHEQIEYTDSSGVEDVKWSNFNPNLFASSHQNGKIQFWDNRSAQKTPTIERTAHQGQTYSIDFSPHSEWLLLSGGEDSDVSMWDIRNISKKLHTFVGHNDAVNVVSWSPSNALQFASGSSDRKIVVWDIQKLRLNTQDRIGNQIVFIHAGHRSKVTDLSWSRQKGVIGSCEQNNIMQIWKISERIQNQC